MRNARCPIYQFLYACAGNWRNSLFVECRKNTCGRHTVCAGFLLAMNQDGCPLLVGAGEFTRMSGQEIDKSECVAVISRQDFESLYIRWLCWAVDDPGPCVLRGVVKKQAGHCNHKDCRCT